MRFEANTIGRPGEYFLKSKNRLVDKFPHTCSDWKREFFFVSLEHPQTKEPWTWNFDTIDIAEKNGYPLSGEEETLYEKIMANLNSAAIPLEKVLSDKFLKDSGIWKPPVNVKIDWVMSFI